MLEKILETDRQLFIFLNSLGDPAYDTLWMYITKQVYWTPFFLFLAYLLQRKIGWKNLGILLLFIALILFCCNESVEFCKATVKRLRPINAPDLKGIVRTGPYNSDTFSFFSGHAANSMASMTFIFLVLRKYYQYAFLIFLYPLIFAYSRIYLGAHYPSDILTGYAFGATYGFIFFKGYQYLQKRREARSNHPA